MTTRLPKIHRSAVAGRFYPADPSELRRMVEELEGIERAEVSVPMPLSPSQKESLKEMLERRSGKKVVLEETVDPAVLGGLVVRVGSTVYDGSVRTQIRQIRENLQKG